MKRVATAIVLVPVVVFLVLRAPVLLLAIVVALVAILAAREFLNLATHYNVVPANAVTYGYIALLFAFLGIGLGSKPLDATYLVGITGMAAATLSGFVFLCLGMTRRELSSTYPAAAASAFAFTYVALPLAMVVHLRQQWAGSFLVLYLFVVVWSGDTFAYYAGRTFGRHKLAPRISPGKTWEGSFASFLGSSAVGAYFFVHAYPVSYFFFQHGLVSAEHAYLATQPPAWSTALVLSGATNIAAQLGDLVESLIKRGAGVKDSGSLLPGHGGMLDRIDALLFAAPVLWYYAAWRVIA